MDEPKNVNNAKSFQIPQSESVIQLPNQFNQEQLGSQMINLQLGASPEVAIQNNESQNLHLQLSQASQMSSISGTTGFLEQWLAEVNETPMDASQGDINKRLENLGSFQPNSVPTAPNTNISSLSATSENAHQPIPSAINDEGLRHIYINNAVKDPVKYIGNTNPVTRAAEFKSYRGLCILQTVKVRESPFRGKKIYTITKSSKN